MAAEETKSAGFGSVVPGPCREMYWHEKSSEQKIEALAHAVEYLTAKLSESLEVIEKLRNHSHNGGEITIPFGEKYNGVRMNESYFFKNPIGRDRDSGNIR